MTPKLIARIDNDEKATHGWNVRVGSCGVTHSKFFADRKHGGPDKARAKAIEWRDLMMATLPRRRDSQFGINRATLNGYAYWQARYPDGKGDRRTKSFSINRHGESEAKRLATDFYVTHTAALSS